MGLFDEVQCECPLPDPGHQNLLYQTKGLENLLEKYTITCDGRLIRHSSGGIFGAGPYRDIEWPIHADLVIYTQDADRQWVEYIARFTRGQVEWIRNLAEARNAPGFRRGDERPPDEDDADGADSMDSSDPDALAIEPPPTADREPASDPEIALLRNLRRDRAPLHRLLAECSDHWGYEDPIYRFYHQSFKVYGIQRTTRSLVENLAALAPDRPLDPRFLKIVEAGTGKAFAIEDNSRWAEATQPLLEAFFHARFFLEMAVRYADLEAPPSPLPSGYAALLALYGLR